MPLIDCKECGNQVSDLAQSCPKCGAPVSKSFITDVDDLAKDTVSTEKRGHGRLKTAAATVYVLQILPFFFNILPFIGAVIFTKININDSKNTWLESHFNYHHKTNKIALIIMGVLTFLIILLVAKEGSGLGMIFFVPYFILPWLIYRSLKGALALYRNKEIGEFDVEVSYSDNNVQKSSIISVLDLNKAGDVFSKKHPHIQPDNIINLKKV